MSDGERPADWTSTREIKANAIAATLLHLMANGRLKEDWTVSTDAIAGIAGPEVAELVANRIAQALDYVEEAETDD